MNQTVQNLYPENSVNRMRLGTDAFFLDDRASRALRGVLDDAVRYIEKEQLLDPVHWRRFAEQFRVSVDGEDRGWRGEYWGKMMRGAAFTYSYTRNPELYRVMRDTVRDMMGMMQENGRISSYSEKDEFWGWDLWCRKYVLLGMQYFLEICEEADLREEIISNMCRQVDYIMSKVGPQAEGKRPITQCSNTWRGLNSSSILEPVVRLYDLTRRKKYLDFAGYIISEGGTSVANIFELAYEDLAYPYQYPITKAYETISCFEGLLEYYRVTGEEKYRAAVQNFAYKLAESEITIIGCAGCTHEYFDHAAARQTDTAYQGIRQETCVTVTWMKFCMQMLLLTGDSKFADCFERSLYNAYLGSFNTERKVSPIIRIAYPEAVEEVLPFDSYASLLPDVRGKGVGGLKMMPDRHIYGCCACIGAAGTGMIGKMYSMLDRDGIVLNLYASGTVQTATPAGAPLTVTEETDYPVGGSIRIRVRCEADETFTVKVRIPAWSKRTELRVMGEALPVTEGYTAISRSWQGETEILLQLDMRTQVLHPQEDPIDTIGVDIHWAEDYIVHRVVKQSADAPYHIALRRGPVILAKDARLGDAPDTPVDIAYDAEGYVDVHPLTDVPFAHMLAFSVPERDGGSFRTVNYSDAGKTWSEESRFACWLPTKH